MSQDPAPGEVIVVARPDDQESWRAIEAACAETPVRGVEVHVPGHIPPVRAGLAAATGDLVAFVDDDAVPNPGWLAAITGPFDDPSVACVGGRVDTPGTAGVVHPDAGHMRWYGKHVGNLGLVRADAPFEVDAVLEGNWVWRTDVLRGLDFLDTFAADDASMYGLDLCLQAKERGYKVVYESKAAVLHTPGPRHDGSTDRSALARTYRSYSRNMTLIGLRHVHGVRRPAFVAWWWFVGERASYGLAAALVYGVRGGFPQPGLVRASFAGRSEGVRAWLRHR